MQIKNGDKPAFPEITSESDTLRGWEMEDTSDVVSSVSSEGGLTKLEYMATHLLAGMLSTGAGVVIIKSQLGEATAAPVTASVILAEKLLRALEVRDGGPNK